MIGWRFGFFGPSAIRGRASFILDDKSGGGLAGAEGGAFDLNAKENFEASFVGFSLPCCLPGGAILSFFFSSSTCKSFDGRKGLSSSSALANDSCDARRESAGEECMEFCWLALNPWLCGPLRLAPGAVHCRLLKWPPRPLDGGENCCGLGPEPENRLSGGCWK